MTTSTPWKYTDQRQIAVFYTDPNTGAMHSASINDPAVQAWIAAGNTPIAPDPPSLRAQAGALLFGGLTITLSGTITLTATFPADPTTQSKIGLVMTSVNTTGQFPGGSANYDMKDAAGNWHTFNVAQYTAVATALAAFAGPLVAIIDGNPNVTQLPSNNVSLTV